VGAVRVYCPRAKGEKRQTPCKLDVYTAFYNVDTLMFVWQIYRLPRCHIQQYFIWRGYDSFIDSQKNTDK
jgi:hypothetical protein